MARARKPKRESTLGKTSPGQGELFLTDSQLAKIILRQENDEKLRRKFARQKKLAYASKKNFIPVEKEFGKIVFVGRNGKRARTDKKGFAIYVTKTGKKQLVIRKQLKNPWAPRKLSEIKTSGRKNLNRAEKQFRQARLKKISGGKVARASRYGGETFTPGSNKGLDDRGLKQIARSLKRAIGVQKSKRVYLISWLAKVNGENGGDVVHGSFSIGRSERFFFLEHPEIFIRTAFYASFATELSFYGYVTTGSANHIRNETGNANKRAWENYHGKDFPGHDFNIVDLDSFEWKIERT